MKRDKQLQQLVRAVQSGDWAAFDALIKKLRGRLADQQKIAFLEVAAHRHLATNSPQQAIPLLKELVQLDSGHSQARFNLGTALDELGDLEGAKAHLVEVTKIDPNYAAAWTNLGLVYKKKGEPLRALQCYARAYELMPADAVCIMNLAIATKDVGNHDAAIELLSRIKDPQKMPDISSLEQFGLLLGNLGEQKQAAVAFSLLFQATKSGRHFALWVEALARSNDRSSVEAILRDRSHSTLASSDQLELAKILCVEGLHEESEDILNALGAEGEKIEGYFFTRGLLEHTLGRHEKARDIFLQSLSRSECVEQSLLMLGRVDRTLGNKESAATQYREVLRRNPNSDEAIYELSLMLLETGPSSEAWKNYEKRFLFFKRTNRFFVSGLLPPVTQAEEITENTVIWAEQGLGENLLFCQLLGGVCSHSAPPYLIAPEKLHRFLASANLQFFKPLARETFYQCPEAYTSEISLCSLGGVLEVDFTKFILTSDSTAGWPKMASTPRVAVSWASYSGTFGEDKTPPVQWFAEMLCSIRNAVFTSVQYSLTADDERFLTIALGDRFVCAEDPDYHNDLVRLKGTLSECDILLTVSNTTAHVAGVLGMPTILLVPKQKGRLWYWHHETDGVSHWYPSVRILAQEQDGDWSSLESAIQQAFQTLTGHIE